VETEIAEKTASGSSTRVYLSILAFLLVVLAGVLVLSMGMGATKIGVREVLTSLLIGHGSEEQRWAQGLASFCFLVFPFSDLGRLLQWRLLVLSRP